jgi:hypothetical protein
MGQRIANLRHKGVLAASALLLGITIRASAQTSPPASLLPDAPSATEQPPPSPDPCAAQHSTVNPEASSASAAQKPCNPKEDKYARFVNTPAPTPMTPRQKGRLAIHDVVDPFNIVTIFLNSGFTVAINSHTAYGPGIKGFGRDAGYSFVQDATGEAIGTWGVCSLLHEDPRYHRMPDATVMRRLAHALSHAVIAQHDDGRLMPNYEDLITYPASAEIANLYVPGVATNLPSTVERVLVGLATEPIDNIITEFLPDFAKRIHVHVVFVQQIIDKVATNGQF